MLSPAKSLTRGKPMLLPLRTVSAVVVPGTPMMPSSRRKGILSGLFSPVRALPGPQHNSRQSWLKGVDFADEQADTLLKTFPSTTDLVKKSDSVLSMTELSSKIDLRSTELSSKIDLLSAELSSKVDLLNAKVDKVLIVAVMCGLLLASPEDLANSFAGKLVAALLSIFVK